MRNRRFLLALVGTIGAIAVSAGAANAATGSKRPSKAAKSHTLRYSGTCPNMGTAST